MAHENEPATARVKKVTPPGEKVDLARELNGFTDAENKPQSSRPNGEIAW